MKKAGRFVVQGTVQGIFFRAYGCRTREQASCSKFSSKILDRKSFGSKFQNFQFISTCSTGGIFL